MELIGNLKKKVDKASMESRSSLLRLKNQKHCDDALLYQKLYIQGEPGGKRGLCPKPRMSY